MEASTYQAAIQLQLAAQQGVTNALKPLQGHHPLLDVVITVFAIQGTTELTQMMKGLPQMVKDTVVRVLKLIKFALSLAWRRIQIARNKQPKKDYKEEYVVKAYTPEKNKNVLYEPVHVYITNVLGWEVAEKPDPEKGDNTVHEMYLGKDDKVDTKRRAGQTHVMERPPDNVECITKFRDQNLKVTFGSETTKVFGVNMQLTEVQNNTIRLSGMSVGIVKALQQYVNEG